MSQRTKTKPTNLPPDLLKAIERFRKANKWTTAEAAEVIRRSIQRSGEEVPVTELPEEILAFIREKVKAEASHVLDTMDAEEFREKIAEGLEAARQGKFVSPDEMLRRTQRIIDRARAKRA